MHCKTAWKLNLSVRSTPGVIVRVSLSNFVHDIACQLIAVPNLLQSFLIHWMDISLIFFPLPSQGADNL